MKKLIEDMGPISMLGNYNLPTSRKNKPHRDLSQNSQGCTKHTDKRQNPGGGWKSCRVTEDKKYGDGGQTSGAPKHYWI